MMKKPAVRGFKWGNVKDYDENLIKDCNENGKYGMIFEVDIEYPEKVVLKHEDLASLPERRKINGVEKLITTLEDKKRYVVHLVALKQAVNYGLTLKKIHRVIEF